MVKTRTLTAVTTIAVVAFGAAAWFRADTGAVVPSVSTAVVTRGAVVSTIEATGTLQPVTSVTVGSQVSGTIASLHADFNDQVRKGQVIARLEPSLLASQVEQARATVQRLEAEASRARVDLTDAETRLARAQKLADEQLIAATELEAAQVAVLLAEAGVRSADAQLVQARASLNQAQVNLGHTTITAPVDGVVVSRSVDVGQTVAASMQAPTLFVIARDLGQMQVNASVDESDIGRVAPGQSVRFTVDAYPDETFTGTVRQVRLDPVIEQNVVSYVTVIDVENPDLKLKPGMTANVSIEAARADDVLRVPSAALRYQPASPDAPTRRKGSTVWVQSTEGLVAVPVQVGLDNGSIAAITGGTLEAGMSVVTGSGTGPVASAPKAGGSASPLLPQRPGRSSAGRSGASGGGAR